MLRLISSVVLIFTLLTGLFAHPGQVVKSFKSPASFATGLTFDGHHLWVADYKADKLFCINPEDGKIIRQLQSPGFWPMGLAWDGNYLWNVDLKQRKIFKIDPASGQILFVVDAPSDSPEGLTWDGQTLWVSDPRADKLMRIDLNDGTAVKILTSPARYPQGLAFDGQYLWCSDRIADEIYMIDPHSGEVILILESPGPYPRGMTWDGKYLWNVDYQKDQLFRLVRRDDEIYSLKNPRHARVEMTHQVKIYGNGNLKNLDVYFALPENLPQQKISTTKFYPENIQSVTDRWGQKFAAFNYREKPAESTIQSRMVVEASISEINYYIFPDNCGTLQDIPGDIRKVFTADGSKYQIGDPYIKNLAKNVVGDETNPYWMARKIFDYVRKTLEYKLEGGWNTAPVVLKRKTGSCSEYSFSFIALCRAVGLPARFVGAIVVRGDDASLDEVFHRWPEVYLPNYGWVPIDPQGGDKSLARDRARNIGHLSNRFLITTQGGGDSRYMGWYYNSYEKYQLDPQVHLNIETFAEWEPLEGE